MVNQRRLQLDGEELELNNLGRAVVKENNIDVHEFSGFPITNNDLENNSLTVAGQNVALGGSTNVAYTNLSDTGSSFPIENSDLKNSSLTIAGNSLSLGGSATPAVTDFNGFPIGASEIDESTITVTDFSGFPLSVGTDTDTPDWNQINNVPTLPEGVTASEATEKLSVDGTTIKENGSGNIEVKKENISYSLSEVSKYVVNGDKYGTSLTVLNITGAGVLYNAQGIIYYAKDGLKMEVTVDGTTKTFDGIRTTTTNDNGNVESLSLGVPIRFENSLKIVLKTPTERSITGEATVVIE